MRQIFALFSATKPKNIMGLNIQCITMVIHGMKTGKNMIELKPDQLCINTKKHHKILDKLSQHVIL